MSRSSDILGLIRGIQLVAGASAKTQEAYLKHLWSHSSVRDAIEKSSSQTSECGKTIITNPGQELQKVGKILQETFARSSVVVEGIRQFSAGGRSSSHALSNSEVFSDNKSLSSSIKNLDIASITLKELENLLSEHNKMRDVNVKPKEVVKMKKVEVKVKPLPAPQKQEVKPQKQEVKPPKPYIAPTASIADAEKQVESVMKFITNYDRPTEALSDLVNSTVPEVSQTKG